MRVYKTLTKKLYYEIVKAFGNETEISNMIYVEYQNKDLEKEAKFMEAHPEFNFSFTTKEQE